MKIVLVNWAKVWDGAGYGGGVNGYCQSLALSLVKRGHDVVSLFGGTTFVPSPTPEQTSPCFIRRHDDWLGVRVFEVINSPVMAPSIVQYQQPLGEVSSPELEAEVSRLFGLIQPDVVHFQNIEGFSIGCVDAARAAGARVIFSLHNYHTICPQVYLMQGHKRVCHDSDHGHNCAECIETKPPGKERVSRARKHQEKFLESQDPELARLTDEFKREWGGFKHEFTWPVRVVKRSVKLVQLRRSIGSIREELAGDGSGIPGHPVDSLEAATAPLHVKEPRKLPEKSDRTDHEPLVERPVSHDHRGQTQGILDELHWKPRELDVSTPERQVLLNVARPDPPSARPPNDYGRRREAMVRMLSSCDRVLAVSAFVRDKFIAMGVDPRAIEALHIGSRIGAIAERHREVLFAPPAFEEPARDVPPQPQRPVRVVFMGYNNRYKGLHILADALELLVPDYLAKIDLSIFALDGKSIEWRFRRMEPRLSRLAFFHGYQYHDIPWMLGGKDLGIVPSVWWDNAPQTVFEFFAGGLPVLGADVGGIPDFVKDSHNGMLFRGNDPYDLARRLVEVLREPWRLSRMRANVRPPKDMESHVLELERIYQQPRP